MHARRARPTPRTGAHRNVESGKQSLIRMEDTGVNVGGFKYKNT